MSQQPALRRMRFDCGGQTCALNRPTSVGAPAQVRAANTDQDRQLDRSLFGSVAPGLFLGIASRSNPDRLGFAVQASSESWRIRPPRPRELCPKAPSSVARVVLAPRYKSVVAIVRCLPRVI